MTGTNSESLESIDLTDLSAFAHGPPAGVFSRLRDEAPLFWQEPTVHTPGGEGFWSLTRHEDVLWAARQADLFSSDTGGGRDGGGTLIEDLPSGFAAGVLFNMQDDPRHQAIRRLVTPSLSPKRLGEIRSSLEQRCEVILDSVVAAGACDFLTDVAAELPVQAIAWLLGVPQEDRHRFLGWADATLDYEDRDLGEQSARSVEAAAEMSAYGSDLLQRKRGCPAEDILSIIANAELPPEADPPGPLSDIEQQMFFSLLIAAGSETTRNSMTAGLLALMEHPEVWDSLREDRSLLPGAIEEMLRVSSSTIYNRRTATRDLELHGRTIAAGDKVVLWWYSANHDERVFPEPERFDIHRDPNPHLAFGYGTHFCLGANLARLEMRLVFDGLLERTERITAAGAPERIRSNKHAGFRHLPVSFSPANH